jgi:hypothetical protein
VVIESDLFVVVVVVVVVVVSLLSVFLVHCRFRSFTKSNPLKKTSNCKIIATPARQNPSFTRATDGRLRNATMEIDLFVAAVVVVVSCYYTVVVIIHLVCCCLYL